MEPTFQDIFESPEAKKLRELWAVKKQKIKDSGFDIEKHIDRMWYKIINGETPTIPDATFSRGFSDLMR